nr:hypothetical protein [Tanacetum cinerariifolium]
MSTESVGTKLDREASSMDESSPMKVQENMTAKSRVTKSDSKVVGQVESSHTTPPKKMSIKSGGTILVSKAAGMIESLQTKPYLFLDKLEVDVTGMIVVMISRFPTVVCLSNAKSLQGNMILCTAKASIAHNFLRLKEVWKVFVNCLGFPRYPFQLIDFDRIDPTNNKYLIDVTGYVTDVGRTNYTKTRSKILIFILQTSDKLYLSSTSSTVIYDNDDISYLQELKTSERYRLEVVVADDTAYIVVVMFDDTATELLKCSVVSLLGAGEDEDDESSLPTAIRNLIRTTHVLEIKSHTYYEYGTIESFTCWKINPSEMVDDSASSISPPMSADNPTPATKRLSRHPSVCTPSKPIEETKKRRTELEDFNVDEISGSVKYSDEFNADGPLHLRLAKKLLKKLHAPSLTTVIDKDTSDGVDQQIVRGLIQMLYHYSPIAKAFRMARDWCNTHNSMNFHPWLHNDRKSTKQYNAPTMSEVTTVIINDFREGLSTRDVIVNSKDSGPRQTTTEIDDIILAELPSLTDDPDGYKVVTDYMLHGPCGKDARYVACTTDGKCSKHFPKAFLPEKYLDEEGYPHYHRRDNKIHSYCLLEIQDLLHRYGRSLEDFKDLPRPDLCLITNMDNCLIREALDFDIIKARIASLLLPAGRTAHNRFVIPLDLMENNTCGIKQNTQLAELMQEVQPIIWDEAPVTQRYDFEALDITLRDILGFKCLEKRSKLFGGMTVLLGGDFKQILPVIPKAKRPKIVQACINRSELWKYYKVFTLTRNMRVNEYSANGALNTSKQEFNRWVLAVGDGNLPDKIKEREDEPTWIEIPERFLIKEWDTPIQQIVAETYSDFTSRKTDEEYLKERAILTPRNEDADAINKFMFKKLSRDAVTYNSADEICKASTDNIDQHQLYPVEFLNSLNFIGMPLHELCLKKEFPIMLLRNVNPSHELCNETRLIITDLAQFVIHTKILTGSHVGDESIFTKLDIQPWAALRGTILSHKS